MGKSNGNAQRKKSSKPYNERTDLEKLQSQWTKLSGLHLREEPSAAIVRCATAAEIAANYAIRAEWARKTEFDDTIIDMFLRWANGLLLKVTRLFVPVYFATPDKRPIGKALKASAENMEWKSLIKRVRAGEFGIARFGWCATDTPFSFMEQFQSQSPRNDFRYKNPKFDELLGRYRCEADPETARKIGAEAEAEVIRDMPFLPVYYYTRYYLKWPVLQGIEPHLEDMHPFKYMWWADVQTAPEARPMPPVKHLGAGTTP